MRAVGAQMMCLRNDVCAAAQMMCRCAAMAELSEK